MLRRCNNIGQTLASNKHLTRQSNSLGEGGRNSLGADTPSITRFDAFRLYIRAKFWNAERLVHHISRDKLFVSRTTISERAETDIFGDFCLKTAPYRTLVACTVRRWKTERARPFLTHSSLLQ